jgi:hypothetical protein
MEHLGHHTQAQLVQLIQGGVPPAMPPSALSEEEVRLVIDYVWTLVPEADVAALRSMQQQIEEMGGGVMPGRPPMEETPPVEEEDHSDH